MGNKKLTDEQAAEIKELHEQGMSYIKLAEKYHCSTSAIGRAVGYERNGLKITDQMLTAIEFQRNVLIVQSDYLEIAYAIDRTNNTMWIINRKTGAELEISAENVYPFAYELMDVADLYVPQQNLFRKGA